MPRVCKICQHSDRAAIEAQMCQRVANLRIATNFKNISEANLRNHLNHFALPARLEVRRRITFDESFQRDFVRLEKLIASFDEKLSDGDKFDVSKLTPQMLRVYLDTIGKLHDKLDMMAKISKYKPDAPNPDSSATFAQILAPVFLYGESQLLTPEVQTALIESLAVAKGYDINEFTRLIAETKERIEQSEANKRQIAAESAEKEVLN